MRCFVAAFPSEEIRSAAFSLAGRVCASIRGARIVPAGNLHLTLQFLGEVPDRDAGALSSGLAEGVSGFAPFRAGFARLGAFPSSRRATVLWTGVGEGKEGFEGLAGRISAVTGRFAQKKAEKPFVPHLTLARFRTPADLSRLEVFSELMQTELGMCTMAGFALMRSRLEPEGPVYEELRSYELKA